MYPAEIVMNGVEGYRMAKVIDFLGEPVGKSGKPPHGHSHGEVCSLNIAGGDVFGVWLSGYRCGLRSKTDRWAIPDFILRLAVNFDQRGVVDVAPESALDGFQIDLQPVSGQLHPVGETVSQVLHKFIGASSVTLSDEVGNGQLCIGINSHPSPHVTVAEDALFLNRDVLFLSVAELPDFIALNSVRFHTANSAVMEVSARRSQLFQESEDGALGNASHAAGGADGVSLNEGVYNGDLLGER